MPNKRSTTNTHSQNLLIHDQGSTRHKCSWDAWHPHVPGAGHGPEKQGTQSTELASHYGRTLQIWQTILGALAPVREAFPA